MSRRKYAAAAAAGVAAAVSLAATSGAAAAQPTSSSAQSPQLVADFNRDGRPDIVVGAPGQDVKGKADAGAVNVLYGSTSSSGWSGQTWTQDSPGVADVPETGDQFGYSVATGDFNGDGYTDLAIGVPYEDYGHRDAGVVNVLYGSRYGLRAAGSQLWWQGSPGIDGVSGTGDRFGYSLATADFGWGRYDDLAVGVPWDDGTHTDDGAVNVIYGSASGLRATRNRLWTQDSYGILDSPETGDRFGYTLAAGNVGGNGFADLAIGVPYEDYGSRRDAGAVNVIYGSPYGLVWSGNEIWYQSSLHAKEGSETGDGFGRSLAIGNLGKSGYADLAVGVPYEDRYGRTNSGAVDVIYGSTSGLAAAGSQFWSQDSFGVNDTAESYDMFGYRLAAGNFGKSGYADLAVGVPYEDYAKGRYNDGAVNVIYGATNGLTWSGDQIWSQDTPGIGNTAENSDLFGYSLLAGNVGRDGYADLVVGVPYEDWGSLRNTGALNVIYGTLNGLMTTGNRVVTQDSWGLAKSIEAGDLFGWSLAGAP